MTISSEPISIIGPLGLSMTVAQALEIAGLPDQLAPYEPLIRRINSVNLLGHVMNDCLCGDIEIVTALEAAISFEADRDKRCPGCLGWTDRGHVITNYMAGQYNIFVLCPRCVTAMEDNESALVIARNIRGYLGDL